MKVYILAPANIITGGPELAHQLCSAINRLTDIEAYMCYITTTPPYQINADIPAPEPYKVYNTVHETDNSVMDRPENVIVVPEGLTPSLDMIKYAKTVLWWMSVDNYICSTDEYNIDYIKKRSILHLYQSYYSYDYVSRKMPGVKGMFLSDYINEAHGQFIYPAELRQNTVLFNPSKGYNDLKPLIEKAAWIEWMPLKNLDLPHMIFLMQESKIYVDFGGHPGKDRIPREAASNGCVVITNKKGSAAYEEDVPIPSKYKFEDPQASLDEINVLMIDICDNFKAHQDAFSDYRDFIKGEKQAFDEAVLEFIGKISG